MYRTEFWALGEGEGGVFREKASKHVYYLGWNGSPPRPVHWENPQESGGEGGGRGEWDGEYM